MRWLGWVVISLVAVSRIGFGLGLLTDAVGAIGLGIVAAGGVLLLLESPAGYPRTDDVKMQLATMGLVSRDLAPGTDQTWGARTLLGTDQHGRSLVAKAYGPDARDAQVGARAWRFLWYRDTEPSLPWSRFQQVEHEALVTVLAKRADVRCPEVIVAATTEDGDAILVTDRRGVSLTETDPDRLSDEILTGRCHCVWRGRRLTLSTDGRRAAPIVMAESRRLTQLHRCLCSLLLRCESLCCGVLGARGGVGAVAPAPGRSPRSEWRWGQAAVGSRVTLWPRASS